MAHATIAPQTAAMPTGLSTPCWSALGGDHWGLGYVDCTALPFPGAELGNMVHDMEDTSKGLSIMSYETIAGT
jgi:hypothetical protein